MISLADLETRDGGPVLCRRDEIGEAGKGLTLAGIDTKYPDRPIDIFLIVDGDATFCYLNVCPHQGIPLDLKPDTFLDYEREFIQCTAHGAVFRKDDGMCVDGPCFGRALIALPIAVEADGAILLEPFDPFRMPT